MNKAKLAENSWMKNTTVEITRLNAEFSATSEKIVKTRGGVNTKLHLISSILGLKSHTKTDLYGRMNND